MSLSRSKHGADSRGAKLKSDYPKVSVKKGREWHLQRGHPWLFSGGISQAPKHVEAGQIVTLLDYEGRFIANGYYNPACDIAVRILSLKANEQIGSGFLEKRIQDAWLLRQRALNLNETSAFRLINAEGDYLPGFIVDHYNGVLVVQCHTAGADLLANDFVEALERILKPQAIVVRNDASVRHREGLSLEEPKIVKGKIDSEIIVKENNLKFIVDPISGQKTGYFTDQRDKREKLAKYAAHLPVDANMLNCFSYTCGFSVYAAAALPSLKTINVDQSKPALEAGKKNFELNNIDAANHIFHDGDAFAFLDREISRGSTYDIVVLDPPAFAKSHKDKDKALKAYGRMATLGLKVTKNNGFIMMCSCSGAISMIDFEECIRRNAGATDRALQIIDTFQHGVDHPINLMAPESSYLKVIICRVLF